jgi:quinol monooxygenase YgiN
MTIDAGSLMEAAKAVDKLKTKQWSLYYFQYSDKKLSYRMFDNYKDASWFAHNEGDHLIKWGPVRETTPNKSL